MSRERVDGAGEGTEYRKGWKVGQVGERGLILIDMRHTKLSSTKTFRDSESCHSVGGAQKKIF